MGDEARVQEMLREIAKLFQDAYQVLTRAKCRVTAMASFNQAMTLLEELERHPDPEVASGAKKAHAAGREAVGKDKSLHSKLRTYAALWSQEG
jgi:hypothetical protein